MIMPQCCVLENSRLTPRGDLPAAERPQHCVLVNLGNHSLAYLFQFKLFPGSQSRNDLVGIEVVLMILFYPSGEIYPPKYPFLAKMVLFSLYLQNRASYFDDFCTDVRDSCPE